MFRRKIKISFDVHKYCFCDDDDNDDDGDDDNNDNGDDDEDQEGGTFEIVQWRKVQQMQPVWLCILSGRRFGGPF